MSRTDRLADIFESFSNHLENMLGPLNNPLWKASIGVAETYAALRWGKPKDTHLPRKITLDNGLQCLVQRKKGDEIQGHLLLKTGSYSDPVGKGGLAHFVEHLMASEFLNEVRERKGTGDAWTSPFFTVVEMSLPWTYENESFLIDGFKNALTLEKLSDDLIEQEKSRILNEHFMRADNPRIALYEVFEKQVLGFNGTHGKSQETRESFESITRQDVLDYVRRHMTGENTVLVFKTPELFPDPLFSQVSERFSSIPAGFKKPQVDIIFQPGDYRESSSHHQLYYNYSFKILGSEKTGLLADFYSDYIRVKLNQSFVEHGNFYSIDAHSIIMPDKGPYLSISGDCMPDQAKKVAPLLAETLGAAANKIDTEIFNDLKKKMLTKFTNRKDFGFADYKTIELSAEMAMEGGTPSLERYQENLSDITEENLLRFSRQYIVGNPVALVALGDSTKLHTDLEFMQMLQNAAKAPKKPGPAPTI